MRIGLKDEGEVTLDLKFGGDPSPKYRIVIPATADSPEAIYNVILAPSDNPDLANVYLENGAYVGTISRPELPT